VDFTLGICYSESFEAAYEDTIRLEDLDPESSSLTMTADYIYDAIATF